MGPDQQQPGGQQVGIHLRQRHTTILLNTNSQTYVDAWRVLTSALREEDVDRIASANVERMRDRLGERLPQVAAAIDVEALHRLCELFLATGDDRDRRLGKAVLAKLVAMIAEARAHVGS